MEKKRGRVLVIAGSDSGGGAGIQADVKTITALGGYAMTALTAVTVQNTCGVFGVHTIPLRLLRQQIEVVLSDIGADVIKTGMLANTATIQCVVDCLDALDSQSFLVVDPVMVAKGGARLLAPEAIEDLKLSLLPKTDLLTPNILEAELLTGNRIQNVGDLRRAGENLLELGVKNVLMKGGHLPGDQLSDILMTGDREVVFEHGRIQTRATHGTGCTLASAYACGLAQGLSLEAAAGQAHKYVLQAIKTAKGFGKGHSPLNHGWNIPPFPG